MENKEFIEIDHNVYALLLEVGETLFLSVQYAESLEEAFSQAKMEFNRINSPKPGQSSMLGAKIGLFSFKTLDQMADEHDAHKTRLIQKIAMKHHKEAMKENLKEKKEEKKVEIKKVEIDPKTIKNILMKEIITRKDQEMYEKNKHLFTKFENQYIQEQITKNVKS